MEQFKAEVVALLSKFWVWFFGILIGVIGKICYEFMTGKKLTLLQVLATAGVSIAIGCMAALWCMYKGIDQLYGAFIVSCATWLGDKLAIAGMSINWNKIADEIARLKLKGK